MKNNTNKYSSNNNILGFLIILIIVVIVCYIVKNEYNKEHFKMVSSFQKVIDVGKVDVHYIVD